MKNNKKGTTLIELITVIAIMSILLAITMPKINIAKTKLKITASTLYNHIKECRIANMNGVSTYISIYSDHEYGIFINSKPKKVPLENSMQLKNKNNQSIPPIVKIKFNSLGVYVGDQEIQTIKIQHETGDFYYITITPVTGRIKLYEKNKIPPGMVQRRSDLDRVGDIHGNREYVAVIN